ncbi:hypothetical protein BpHYR1_032620 [Brachionus plicatilis]|uniref:Uncharacterized protein n=1 Tax=Brachionus plicatilis TaxID=10195 RepID=A0A3M7R8L8_BRAPC|nr:hypothetical protein BpHYR1_032620 [Brachionus plicatilis]
MFLVFVLEEYFYGYFRKKSNLGYFLFSNLTLRAFFFKIIYLAEIKCKIFKNAVIGFKFLNNKQEIWGEDIIKICGTFLDYYLLIRILITDSY